MQKTLVSRILAVIVMFAMMGMESSWVFAQNLPNLTSAAPSAAASRAAAPAAPASGAPSGTITVRYKLLARN